MLPHGSPEGLVISSFKKTSYLYLQIYVRFANKPNI